MGITEIKYKDKTSEYFISDISDVYYLEKIYGFYPVAVILEHGFEMFEYDEPVLIYLLDEDEEEF